ncbi:hypothetical protein [Magnetospirillum sp. 15-1]|uniref:hypothetical protein n=1 Tax=Magnetospirillum sp. 15-1 TaxID=1979370 RepID=UPI000BBCC3C7|nr:hypothetical protein [Magnetospirillum sp. 15-1]
MPFLHIPSLGNRREHPCLGAPTFAGVTLTDVTPAAVTFFTAAGLLRTTLTAAEAGGLIIAEIMDATSVVAAITEKALSAIAEAGKLVEEAGKLAALPVVGDEKRTIEGFAAIVRTGITAAGLPHETTGKVTYLKSVMSQAHGLDIKGIEGALGSFDRALAAHEAAMEKLQAAHARLGVLAAQADDGPSRDKVAKLKASLDFKRKLPGALDALAAGREQIAAALARIDLVMNTLKECAA